MDKINGFEAIKEMRKLTKQGKSFNLVHSTYSTATGLSEGIVLIRHAATRTSLPSDAVHKVPADCFFNYYDIDRKEPRRCWKVLLLSFNDKKITWEK